jgi:hypothetical protein
MTGVPQEWNRVVASLVEAQVAGAVMRHPKTPSVARDQATDRYVRAVDAIVADLGLLREQLVLTRITALLARGGRS